MNNYIKQSLLIAAMILSCATAQVQALDNPHSTYTVALHNADPKDESMRDFLAVSWYVLRSLTPQQIDLNERLLKGFERKFHGLPAKFIKKDNQAILSSIESLCHPHTTPLQANIAKLQEDLETAATACGSQTGGLNTQLQAALADAQKVAQELSELQTQHTQVATDLSGVQTRHTECESAKQECTTNARAEAARLQGLLDAVTAAKNSDANQCTTDKNALTAAKNLEATKCASEKTTLNANNKAEMDALIAQFNTVKAGLGDLLAASKNLNAAENVLEEWVHFYKIHTRGEADPEVSAFLKAKNKTEMMSDKEIGAEVLKAYEPALHAKNIVTEKFKAADFPGEGQMRNNLEPKAAAILSLYS